MPETTAQFDHRPHQQGVEHGPYVPATTGREEEYRQLEGHQLSVWEAQHEGGISREGAEILLKGIKQAERQLDDDAMEEYFEEQDKRKGKDPQDDDETPDPDMWYEARAGVSDQESIAAAYEHDESERV